MASHRGSKRGGNAPFGIDDYMPHEHESAKARLFEVTDEAMVNYQPGKQVPKTAQEYMKFVRHEEGTLPNVAVSKPAFKPRAVSRKLSRKTTANVVPGAEYAPKAEWVGHQIQIYEKAKRVYDIHVQKFSLLKPHEWPVLPISPLPHWQQKDDWRYYCYGNRKNFKKRRSDLTANEKVTLREHSQNSKLFENRAIKLEGFDGDEIELGTLENGYGPLMRILLRLDVNHTESLMKFNAEWIDEYGYSLEQGSWIYALIVTLRKDELMNLKVVMASMKSISRKCEEERCNVGFTNISLLNSLNLLITIIGTWLKENDLLG